MNNDLIRREYLEDAFDNLCCHNCKTCRNFRNEDSFYKCKLIENAPTVEIRDNFDIGYVQGLEDGQKRPQGKWKRIDQWTDGGIYCGGFIHIDCPMIKVSDDCLYSPWEYKFCPNCGADMRGGRKV